MHAKHKPDIFNDLYYKLIPIRMLGTGSLDMSFMRVNAIMFGINYHNNIWIFITKNMFIYHIKDNRSLSLIKLSLTIN
jgi:hypothetical protein